MNEQFALDGFVVEPQLLDLRLLHSLHDAFDDLFAGRFATGIKPDEVNWQHATGDPRRTRQICNGWKADDRISAVVLDPGFATRVADLMGWPGARLIHDNVLWKPPGATELGFHRDNDYSHWFSPAEMATCWIALDSTTEAGGTLEFALSGLMRNMGVGSTEEYIAELVACGLTSSCKRIFKNATSSHTVNELDEFFRARGW